MADKSSEGKKKIVIPRITQLDAAELDGEIYKVLYNRLMEIVKFLKPGTLNNVREEIKLILNLMILNYSLVSKNATFGQELLSLKYENSLSKIKIVFYAFLKYLLPYLRAKYDDCIGRENHGNISKIAHTIDVVAKVSHLLNLLIFLKKGVYPTVTDRLLKLKYVPGDKFNRNVSYNLMMRQLLWHGFTELLSNTLPLINYKAIQRRVKMFFVFNNNKNKIEKNITHTIKTKCAICNDFPITPCQISSYCSHLACYYCLKTNLFSDEKFICPECNEPNTAAEKLVVLGNCND